MGFVIAHFLQNCPKLQKYRPPKKFRPREGQWLLNSIKSEHQLENEIEMFLFVHVLTLKNPGQIFPRFFILL